jgi:hypothetical protein
MPLETAQIRRRVKARLDQVKRGAAARRDHAAAAERAYATYLADIATPVFNAVASSLSAEGFPFRVSTPGTAVRMDSERAGRTYLELHLDTSGSESTVLLEVSRERGNRVLNDERPVAIGAAIDTATDEGLLDLMVDAIGDLIER